MSMRRLLRPLFLGLVIISTAAAAVRDLQPDLAYVPLAELATANLPADRARILDARASSTAEPSAELTTSLAAPSAPTLLLLDDQPPAWLVATLATRPKRLLTLAARDYASPLADITVDTPRDADQAARDALADPATGLDVLLSRNAAKRRFDEAALVEARSGNGPTRRPSSPTPATTSETPPPTDLVLERAVQIYQGLRALGRW
jgi:hypothetical protein